MRRTWPPTHISGRNTMARTSCAHGRKGLARQLQRAGRARRASRQARLRAGADAHGEEVADVEGGVHHAVHARAHQRAGRRGAHGGVVRRQVGLQVGHAAGADHEGRPGRAAALLGAPLGCTARRVRCKRAVAAILSLRLGPLLARRPRGLHAACAARRDTPSATWRRPGAGHAAGRTELRSHDARPLLLGALHVHRFLLLRRHRWCGQA